jgi:hypothetical protein
MKEGWHGDEYVILFEGGELEERQKAYKIDFRLPGYRLLGLVGWDDFLVKDFKTEKIYSIPTVPIADQHKQEWLIEIDHKMLKADPRFQGKVKWYVKPIVFGGNPSAGENMIWISHEDHVQLVNYWNKVYSEVKHNR